MRFNMRNVRVTYYGHNHNKKVANFKILENDILELIETTDYKNKFVIKKEYDDSYKSNLKPIKKGFGEVVASFTKLFGFKPCAPCNKRRKYLNNITPMWIVNILSKLYK